MKKISSLKFGDKFFFKGCTKTFTFITWSPVDTMAHFRMHATKDLPPFQGRFNPDTLVKAA